MKTKCKVCDRTFSSDGGLHVHIRSHGITQQEYYHKYYPRFDLLTNKLIRYKNKKQYFSDYFNRVDGMHKWFDSSEVDVEEKKKLLKRYLERWAEETELKYIPCEVELTSRNLPHLREYIDILGEEEFLRFCKTELLLTQRHKVLGGYEFTAKDLKVFIDTREQKPLTFPDSESMKLSVGDYTCAGEDFEDVFVERKSGHDLINTMSSGFDRFKKEIERAKERNHYLVVVVEDSIKDIRLLMPKKKYGPKTNGKFICHRIRDLLRSYDNLQFVFVGRRSQAASAITNILSIGDKCRDIDLQILHDLGGL